MSYARFVTPLVLFSVRMLDVTSEPMRSIVVAVYAMTVAFLVGSVVIAYRSIAHSQETGEVNVPAKTVPLMGEVEPSKQMTIRDYDKAQLNEVTRSAGLMLVGGGAAIYLQSYMSVVLPCVVLSLQSFLMAKVILVHVFGRPPVGTYARPWTPQASESPFAKLVGMATGTNNNANNDNGNEDNQELVADAAADAAASVGHEVRRRRSKK